MNLIIHEDALRNADSVTDLRLRNRVASKDARKRSLLEDVNYLTLEEKSEDAQIMR